jgi:hypothetical protein
MNSGLYRHFKGNLYRVQRVAVHSETKEELVVYKSLVYKTWWIRPLAMFNELVGIRVPRFRRLPWWQQMLFFWKR